MVEQLAEQGPSGEILRMTADIVSAYVGKSNLPAQQLPDVINLVFNSLSGLQHGVPEPVQEALKPAVPIRRSITPEHIICLEDGKKLRMLKRHLRTTYNMTPSEYRAKWGLPADYPMVAPNYAKQRSDFAKRIGLGRKSARRPRKKSAA
jgi:predicted transcriptional regulator